MIKTLRRDPDPEVGYDGYTYLAVLFTGADAAALPEDNQDVRYAAEAATYDRNVECDFNLTAEGYMGQPGQWFQHRPSVRRSRTRVLVVATAGYDV